MVAPGRGRSGDTWFGQPRGLVYLAGTELWERISFHGMLALLTLYMAEQLLLPGHIETVIGLRTVRHLVERLDGPLSVEGFAAQLFGLYAGLIYFTPVFGGYIGDRWIGRRNAVLLGGGLMAAGHFLMIFDATFLGALLLLILGAGFLRGNLIAQVDNLYARGDPRSSDGIQIYYAMVNVGGFAAPLITGVLARLYGWHAGFAFAGLGMVAGLAIYLAGSGAVTQPARGPAAVRAPLTRAERRTVLTLLALLPLFILFFIGLSQEWNVYNLWARDLVDLRVFGWSMPVPWVQSLMAVECVVLVPVVLYFWRWLDRRGRGLDDLGKLALGCTIFAVFTLMDGLGGVLFPGSRSIPLAWIVVTSCGTQFGYLNVQPVAIALYARAAPRSVNALMIGVYFMAIFFGSIISGRLGAFYGTTSAVAFWALHAGLVAVAGLMFLLLRRPVRRWLDLAGEQP